MIRLRKFLRNLFLPAFGIDALRPYSGIVESGDDYDWTATEQDPKFAVIRDGKSLSPGWYMLEVTINSRSSMGIVTLASELEYSTETTATTTLPYQSRHTTKRLCFFPHRISRLYFSPVDTAEDFSITWFRLAKVTRQFAIPAMRNKLTKLSFRSGRPTSDTPGDQSSKERMGSVDDLYRIYGDAILRMGISRHYSESDYHEWIERVEQTLLPSNEEIASAISGFSIQPIISVILPTYDPDPDLLRLCIESILRQKYPHWELCIADDASRNPDIKLIINEFAEDDERIKTILREFNGHISAATNSGIELATGDFLAFMDHDDLLSEYALFYIVESINDHPGARIIYSDEDKVDESGRRSSAHMKPDWNPDLFLSQNYLSHLTVIDATLVRDIGGLRTGVEGSQDFDLLLRCIPEVSDQEIVHVPKILYHWRMTESSAALSDSAKPYTITAGLKALDDYLKSTGASGKVARGMVPNTYKITYHIPKPEPLVSILIPTRDNLTTLKACLASILDKTTYKNYKIIILNNQSANKETLSYLAESSNNPIVEVLDYDHAFNYSAINNFGVENTNGDLICLLNDDTEVITPEWLTIMVSHALRPAIGCVGAKLYFSNGQIQHAGVILGLKGVANHSHKFANRNEPGYFARLLVTQNYSAVTAACLLVRRSVYQEVGGLNEKDLPISFNDIDFCLKVREAGYWNLWTPYAELYHHESVSRGFDDTPEKSRRAALEENFMKEKWGKLLARDPAYNINLTLTREDFSLE